jgi:putative cell wall-binding protein
MRIQPRVFVSASLAFLLLFGVMPAGAYAALSMTWQENIGTFDGSAPWADGELYIPRDVATDKWGNIYVTDGFSGPDRVQMFNHAGDFVKKYDNPGTGATQLSDPRSVVTDRWGAIYVTQQGNARIEVFNPRLYNHERTISTPATPPSDSVGIAVGLDGTIYNSRQWADVQVRDRFGNFITSFSPPQPMGIGVSQDGELYVAVDEFVADPQNLIGVYNPDLTLKFAWGGTGTAPGEYRRPWDVGVDGAGDVFVVEYGQAELGHRVQVLSPNSDPLAAVGSYGSDDQQFGNPSGIGVGLDRTVYVADSGHSRISKWKVATPTTFTKVEGDTRHETAVAASKKAYPDPNAVDIVVLATGANWPDALGGAALAGTVNGPLLLTTRDTIPAAVAAEITRLAPKRVYVLGGSDVVSNAAMNAAKALTTMGIATRLEGPTRYETAIKIAAEVKAMQGVEYDGTAFVCTGENFPDALAVSPIAAANGWPIYLTPTAALPASVATAMMTNAWGGNPTNHGYIIGGESAVSASVADTLDAAPFMGFMRIDGSTRYETAAEVADIGFDGLGMLFSRPAIATGENFPDALAGGVLQGSDYSVMLLTRGGSLSPEAAALLTKYKDHIYDLRFLGGSDVVTPAVRSAAQALLW